MTLDRVVRPLLCTLVSPGTCSSHVGEVQIAEFAARVFNGIANGILRQACSSRITRSGISARTIRCTLLYRLMTGGKGCGRGDLDALQSFLAFVRKTANEAAERAFRMHSPAGSTRT